MVKSFKLRGWYLPVCFWLPLIFSLYLISCKNSTQTQTPRDRKSDDTEDLYTQRPISTPTSGTGTGFQSAQVGNVQAIGTAQGSGDELRKKQQYLERSVLSMEVLKDFSFGTQCVQKDEDSYAVLIIDFPSVSALRMKSTFFSSARCESTSVEFENIDIYDVSAYSLSSDGLSDGGNAGDFLQLQSVNGIFQISITMKAMQKKLLSEAIVAHYNARKMCEKNWTLETPVVIQKGNSCFSPAPADLTFQFANGAMKLAGPGVGSVSTFKFYVL